MRKEGAGMKRIQISSGYIYLDNAHVRLFTSFIYRDFGDTLDPILDSICYMGNDLWKFSLLVGWPMTFWVE